MDAIRMSSEEERRYGLVKELRDALEEVAQLSERMATVLSTRMLDESKLQDLRNEMDTAKALASRLRAAIDTLDASSNSEADARSTGTRDRRASPAPS